MFEWIFDLDASALAIAQPAINGGDSISATFQTTAKNHIL